MEKVRTLLVLVTLAISVFCDDYDLSNDHLLHIVKLPSNIYKNKHHHVNSVFTRNHYDVGHAGDLSYADGHGLGVNHDLGYSPQKHSYEFIYLRGHNHGRYKRSYRKRNDEHQGGGRDRYDHDRHEKDWDDGWKSDKHGYRDRGFDDRKHKRQHQDKWQHSHGIDPWEKPRRSDRHEHKSMNRQRKRYTPHGGYEMDKVSHREDHHSSETKWDSRHGNNGGDRWSPKTHGRRNNRDNKWESPQSHGNNNKWLSNHRVRQHNDNRWASDSHEGESNNKWASNRHGRENNDDRWASDSYENEDNNKWESDNDNRWVSDNHERGNNNNKWDSSRRRHGNDKWESSNNDYGNDNSYDNKWSSSKEDYDTDDSWGSSSKYSPPSPPNPTRPPPSYKPASRSTQTKYVSPWVISEPQVSKPYMKQVTVVKQYGNQPQTYQSQQVVSRSTYTQPQAVILAKPETLVSFTALPKPEQDYRV